MNSNPIRLIITVITAIIINHSSDAQAQGHSIQVLTKVGADGVWLRWAPGDYATWQLGNKYGYQIDRYALKGDGMLASIEPVRLNALPVKPFSRARLVELGKSLEEAVVIEELIYERQNGGSAPGQGPAALMQQREEQDNQFGMALVLCDFFPRLAEAAGLFRKDTTAVRGERYIYKISLAQQPENMVVDPAVAVVDVEEAKPLQAFKDVEAEFGDASVTISWPVMLHRGIYTAYTVEKSEDGNNFSAINDLPYIPMSQDGMPEEAHFVDSLRQNGKVYYYRVKGITSFGETGPPSNVVSGAGKDNLSGLVILREVKRDAKNDVVVRWEFPVADEPKINGFVVERGAKAEGPFTAVAAKALNGKTREMTDNTVTSSAYYRILAVDAAGHELTHSQAYFFHVEDNVPPAVPVSLQGRSDNKGIVTLRWKPNRDKDLLGYRIFSANDPKHEFVEVTREIVGDSTYRDTINIKVLNKHIYYTVVAVDNNFNVSGYSKPYRVPRPDVIAPAPPVFSKAEVKNNAVNLQWVNSVSEDVAVYTLYRTVVAEDKSTLTIKAGMTHWDARNPQTTYADNTVLPGKTYQYVLEAADSAGNVSTGVSTKVNTRALMPADVTEFKALIDRDNKLIILRWRYPSKFKRCLLYRKKGDEPFSLYQSLETSGGEFIDKLVSINTTYAYRIQLVLDDNAKTKLSEVLKVPF